MPRFREILNVLNNKFKVGKESYYKVFIPTEFILSSKTKKKLFKSLEMKLMKKVNNPKKWNQWKRWIIPKNEINEKGE